ncbi:(2,3-dihydroxybenzoyl)adenylate synthase [Corynebacterium hylobatis]|uniref:(2,3-dihydroxybenzoyl)adenylate synthase n=1 Tax=Corynebacterium hylobatis TaxID=1859290 RepID=A0A430HUX5_9CORY|nr:AMP-binding protein [Corynebacterium hylobatis]RSZ61383.1 (2,3-dihydroxybenzoyl)adenylate synthase [Corynebacterium hylobatis]
MTETPMPGMVPWPEELVEFYRSEGLWQDRNLFQYIEDTARSSPSKTALVDTGDGSRLSYREVIDRANAAAWRMRELGFREQDRVVIVLPNSWQLVVLLLACFRTGVIPVMALAGHRRYELTHISARSQARALFTMDTWRDFDFRPLTQELENEVDTLEWSFIARDHGPHARSLDDLLAPLDLSPAQTAELDAISIDPLLPALFQLSGGTTGLPKLITRTHNDYAYNIEVCSEVAGLTEDDVQLAALPLTHNFGLACPGVLGALTVGATSVLAPSPNPVKVFEAMEQEQVTTAVVVPAVAQRWIAHEAEHRTGKTVSLRVLQVGGSRMPDELAPRVQAVLGATLQQVYGMAEGLINMTRLDDPEEVITTTQGRPVSPHDEVRIVDPEGNDLPDGERGLLLTRGPYTPRGYFNAPEANEKSFLDGWYCPGDVVVRRPDGNLVVQGRDKDIINRGGEKISAEEVESLLYQIDGVEQLAVVAMPDEVYGEKVCLYAVIRDGHTLTLEQACEHLREVGIAAHNLPERIEIVDRLPMTKIRKIDKKVLREDIAAKLAAEEQ